MNLSADQFKNKNNNFKTVVFEVTDGSQAITPVTDKVTVTVTEKSDNVTYDGTEHSVYGYETIVSDNTLYDVTKSVKETSTSAWTAKGTNAGTYDVGIVAGDFANINNNFSNVEFKIVDGSLIISPVSAEVVVTVVENSGSVHYDAQEHSISGYTSITSDNALYNVKDSVVETSTAAWTATGTLAGTYDLGIVAADFANNNKNFNNVKFNIVDGALVIDDEDVPDGRVVNKTHDGDVDKTDATALGQTVTFDITIKNIYNETKTVTVEEKEGFTLSETTFSMAAGEEKTITATHVVTEEDILAGKIDNAVTVNFDSKSWGDDDTIETVVPYANLVVNKTTNVADGTVVQMGDTITYTVTAQNDGNISMKNVVVTDELLGQTWNVDVLEPMQTVTFTQDYVVTQADSNRGYVTNVATATAETDDPDNPTPGGDDEVTTPVETQTPSLVITKTANITAGAVAGDVITYTIVATNNGTSELTNVVVTDALTGDAWNIDSLASGASQTFTTTYTVTVADMAAGSVANTATGTADNPTDTPTTITPGTEITTTDEPVASMNVNKIIVGSPANGQFYAEGEDIAYRITVTNTGNVELTNIRLDDTLVPVDPIASLAPGATETIEYTYTVTADDADAGFVTNTVTGYGTAPDGTDITPGGGETPDQPGIPSATDTSEVTAEIGVETIDDNPTPLAGADCWVHWWIILGALVTLIYGAGVIVRRKKFTNSVMALDKELTGSDEQVVADAETVKAE